MLIQALVLVVAMVVLSGAVLTSTLVAAKVSFRQNVVAKSFTAMHDATAAFVDSTAKNVEEYGTEHAWPATAPQSETLCGDEPGPAPAPACPFAAIMRWTITGRSAGAVSSDPQGPPALTSEARNLAQTVDEQRISATISVRVTDASGNALYASRSREVTARIFNAKPYVVITGSRDASTAAGSIHAGEGDTGGAPPVSFSGRFVATPDPADPSQFTDTRIRASIDCLNSTLPFDNRYPNDPQNTAKFVDYSIRPFGNKDWAFEAPCNPEYEINNMGAPSGYATPLGSVYYSNPTNAIHFWRKNDEGSSWFPK